MANTAIYTVNAGDNVGFTVDAAISHPGPLSVWMSKAPSGTTAAEYDGSGDWFKVYELTTYEITSAGLQWATYIPGSSGIQNFTLDLPAELESGDYLLRAEHVALHAAEEFEGAQYYIGCAQLSLTGGASSASPSPVSSIPGQYTGYEAGLIIDIYYPIPTNYTAPGISTWPDACISHWPNLVDQTYYGLCYNSESLSHLVSSTHVPWVPNSIILTPPPPHPRHHRGERHRLLRRLHELFLLVERLLQRRRRVLGHQRRHRRCLQRRLVLVRRRRRRHHHQLRDLPHDRSLGHRRRRRRAGLQHRVGGPGCCHGCVLELLLQEEEAQQQEQGRQGLRGDRAVPLVWGVQIRTGLPVRYPDVVRCCDYLR